jgi:hypothetical protein
MAARLHDVPIPMVSFGGTAEGHSIGHASADLLKVMHLAHPLHHCPHRER